MRRHRSLLIGVAAGLFGGLGTFVALGAQVASASASHRKVFAGTAAPSSAQRVGSVSASAEVQFDLVLALRDQSGAVAELRAVSTPGSSSYRQYLSARQWESRYSPAPSDVAAASRWLRSQGFTVGAVPADRLVIPASGTASQVESAFQTGLAEYRVAGHEVRLATDNLSVPDSLSAEVIGAMGIDQDVAEPGNIGPGDLPAGADSASSNAGSSQYPPPPPAFITAPPCSTYFGQLSTALSPPFTNDGYDVSSAPDEVCGYKPAQMRGAYGVSASTLGKGATIGIVDAYDSATIANDAATYTARNDPSFPFSLADFQQIDQTPFDQESTCGASSWLVEQALDVESAHAVAPEAHIVYDGAADCFDPGLFAADQNLIDNQLVNVVTDSWGDPAGDLLDSSSTRQAFDNLFLMAETEGITVLFASGDWDDNFYLTGVSAPAYPASSPYVTAVGGTTTEIGGNERITHEYGWDTGRSFKCTSNVEGLLPGCSTSTVNTWLPTSLDGASGGGTSYSYAEPYWQQPVVPSSLADRNSGDTGEANRVIPDISLDADPSTGFLVGLTEQFSSYSGYGQTRYGGTSLASPLLAGLVADADGKAGTPVGFIDPTIYGLDRNTPSAIVDIASPGKQGIFRQDYTDQLLGTGKGYLDSFRELYYLGFETYCDGSGECYSRRQPLRETSGYDSLTGLGAPGSSFIADLAAF